MAQASEKKPGPITVFWTEHFDKKTEVSNAECTEALIKLLEKQDEKEPPSYQKDDKSRREFASLVASRIFWPVEDKDSGTSHNVTKKSIYFACKKKTFGNWETLFPEIAKNFDDPKMPMSQLQCFWGRADFESVIKKHLKKEGDYCMRFNDDGGFELCFCKKMHGDSKCVRETIVRRKLKKEGVVFQWEESVAKVGGNKIEKRNFNNVCLFIKKMTEKKCIKNAKTVGSAYKTMVSPKVGSKAIGMMDEITKAM